MPAPLQNIDFIDLKKQYLRLKPEIDARMQAVLDHGQYIMGPEVKELEQQLAAYVGVKHAIGVSDGTTALQIALMALGIGFLLRSTAGAITMIVSLLFVADLPLQMMSQKWEWAGKLMECLPRSVAKALSDLTTNWSDGTHFLTQGQAIAIFAAWAIIPVLVGWFFFAKRDA